MAVAVAVAVAVSGGGAVAVAGLPKRFFNHIQKDFLINVWVYFFWNKKTREMGKRHKNIPNFIIKNMIHNKKYGNYAADSAAKFFSWKKWCSWFNCMFFILGGPPGAPGPRPPQNENMQLNQLHHFHHVKTMQLNQLHNFHIFYYEPYFFISLCRVRVAWR